MQSHEHLYENVEQQQAKVRPINTDPREQRTEGAEQPAEYRAYEEGYGGTRERDFWSEGEKLRPVQGRWINSGRGVNPGGLIVVLLIVAAVLVFGGVISLIWSWLAWLAATALIIIGVFAIIINWRTLEVPQPLRTFQIQEHARLRINNSVGNVTIRRGEEQGISVQATKRAAGVAANVENIQISYEQFGDTVSVVAKVPWHHIFLLGWSTVRLEITIPANCDVDLHTGAGKVALQGAQGNIRVHTGSGQIEANDLQGHIQMKTGSGRITLDNLQGQIRTDTGSGSIRGSRLHGAIELKTGSGRIELDRSHLVGSSDIKTGSGGIEIEGEFEPLGDTRIHTGSGKVRLAMPYSSAFSLDARTGSGNVHNEFGASEVGDGPKARLQVRSGSGGIYLSRSVLI